MECASSVALIVVIAWGRRMIGRQERCQEDLFVAGPVLNFQAIPELALGRMESGKRHPYGTSGLCTNSIDR
jgi:hypothetical protein